jgi:hypothetical protein
MATELIAIEREDFEELVRLAHEDDHQVVAPTHKVVKHGEIIGYASVNGAPSMHWWLHTKKGKARDTLELLDQVDEEFLKMGITAYLAPVGNQSPYRKILHKIGFEFRCTTSLFFHNILAYRQARRAARDKRRGASNGGASRSVKAEVEESRVREGVL